MVLYFWAPLTWPCFNVSSNFEQPKQHTPQSTLRTVRRMIKVYESFRHSPLKTQWIIATMRRTSNSWVQSSPIAMAMSGVGLIYSLFATMSCLTNWLRTQYLISSYELSLFTTLINILKFFLELSDWTQLGRHSLTYALCYQVLYPVSSAGTKYPPETLLNLM